MVESMQQSSATPPYISVFWGCGRLLHALNHTFAVASCIYSFWHDVIPTSTLVRCRDDSVPRSHCKVWLRACNNLPQPQKNKMWGGGCGRLLHALNSGFLYLQFLARCHPYILLTLGAHAQEGYCSCLSVCTVKCKLWREKANNYANEFLQIGSASTPWAL